MDNEPVITPLVILATKWASSSDGPELLALVQWQGLLLEDTSWESWTELKEEYHLEDKVLSDVAGDVMKQQQNKTDKKQTNTHLRDKRELCKPHNLEDFVTSFWTKR